MNKFRFSMLIVSLFTLVFSALMFLFFSENTVSAQRNAKSSDDIFSEKIFTGKRVAPDISATRTFEEIIEFDKANEPPSMKYILQSKGKRPRNPPAEIMPDLPSTFLKDNPGMFFDYEKFNKDQPVAPAVVSPTPNDDFQALDDGGTSIPPDTHGAAGPNHLMTSLNTQIRIQNKTGGTISTVGISSFFASVGGGSGTFDPRIVYDQMASRWIAVAVDDAVASTSKVLIAVSQTTDPTGTWNFYGYDHDGANIEWADYPMVGYNKDWIAVAINDFLIAGGFGGANMYVFDKSTLYAGAVTPTLTKIDLGTGIGNVHQPAETFDNTESTLFVLQRWNASFLRMHTITGPVGSPTFTSSTFFPGTSAWNNTVVPASQSGSAITITTNDTRMQSVIYRDGSLWGTHTIGLPSTGQTRTSVQWWELNPLAGTVKQVGRIDDPTGTNFYAFPSIAVNAANQAIIGYSTFSSTTFASAGYSYRGISEATSTTQDHLTYKNGIGCYNKTFSGSTNRWGDYSHISVDPNDDSTFWVLQEYADAQSGATVCGANTGRWATWWAKVIPPCTSVVATGNWNVSGTWGCGSVPTATTDAVIATGQTVTLNVNPVAANVVVNSGGTLAVSGTRTATTDIVVNGTVDLTNGILDMGANTLKISCGGATTGASSTGYVIGNVEKEFCAAGSYTYPVGENGYSPMTANVTAIATNPTTLTVDAIDSTLGDLAANNSASRSWDLNGSGLTADLSFTYLDADVMGVEANYSVFRKIGAAPPTNQCTGPCVNTATNTATATGQNTFSTWGVGNLVPTAAAATVSGRVLTGNGRGIGRAVVSVSGQTGLIATATSNLFGYYSFEELPVGETYTFIVSSKQYRFTPRTINLEDNMLNFNLVASP